LGHGWRGTEGEGGAVVVGGGGGGRVLRANKKRRVRVWEKIDLANFEIEKRRTYISPKL